MPPRPEVSTAIALPDTISDGELVAVAEHFIENYKKAHAKGSLDPSAIVTSVAATEYLDGLRRAIKMNNPRMIEIFAGFVMKQFEEMLATTQPPDPSLTTLGVPEA